MAVDRLAFDHKRDIAELWLVEDGQEVSLVGVGGLESARAHHSWLAQKTCCACLWVSAAASCLAYSTAHLLLILLLTAMVTHHLGRVNDTRGIVIRSSCATGHVLIEVVHARLDGVRSVVTARQTLIVDHHAVNLL